MTAPFATCAVKDTFKQILHCFLTQPVCESVQELAHECFLFSLYACCVLKTLLQQPNHSLSVARGTAFLPYKLGLLLTLCVWLFMQYCCRSFMLWSVNNGGGYPYPNGTDIATYVSASDFKLLDTNGDGSITMADDPYAPYYPVRKFPLLLDSD